MRKGVLILGSLALAGLGAYMLFGRKRMKLKGEVSGINSWDIGSYHNMTSVFIKSNEPTRVTFSFSAWPGDACLSVCPYFSYKEGPVGALRVTPLFPSNTANKGTIYCIKSYDIVKRAVRDTVGLTVTFPRPGHYVIELGTMRVCTTPSTNYYGDTYVDIDVYTV